MRFLTKIFYLLPRMKWYFIDESITDGERRQGPYSIDEIHEFVNQGKISDNTDLLTRLPDYNGDTVVISKKIKGDGAVYTLYVVKSGVLQNGLDITLHYVVSKDKRVYSFKDFVINTDYRISIYTEEKEAGERPQSGGDYYRIDNFGEFYKANW